MNNVSNLCLLCLCKLTRALSLPQSPLIAYLHVFRRFNTHKWSWGGEGRGGGGDTLWPETTFHMTFQPLVMMTFVLQDGWKPLHAASCKGHLDVVKTLLEAGANINQATKVQ